MRRRSTRLFLQHAGEPGSNRTIPAVLLIIILAASILVTSCVSTASSKREAYSGKKLPLANNMASKASLGSTAKALKKAGLRNTDTFKKWVADFNKTCGKGTGLTSKWVAPKKLKYDTAKMANRWEKKYSYSDSDCRMTAFLLIKDSIRARTTETRYKGDYLMFDVDAIKNAGKYKALKKKIKLFTTLFGEKPAKNVKAAKKSLGKAWKKHGIRLKAKNAKLLSVVIYDKYQKTTFVGHTGLLLDNGSYMTFVEKIAFEQPYQVTKVKDLKQLKKVLGARPEYFGGPDDPAPYIYLNGKYKGELKPAA